MLIESRNVPLSDHSCKIKFTLLMSGHILCVSPQSHACPMHCLGPGLQTTWFVSGASRLNRDLNVALPFSVSEVFALDPDKCLFTALGTPCRVPGTGRYKKDHVDSYSRSWDCPHLAHKSKMSMAAVILQRQGLFSENLVVRRIPGCCC